MVAARWTGVARALFNLIPVGILTLFGGLVLLPAALTAMVSPGVAKGSGAVLGPQLLPPSAQANDEIPVSLILLYAEASMQCVGLPWQLLASVAAQESDHGRHGGASVDAEGWVQPVIRGIRLDGTMPGTMVVLDTDDGVLDGDAAFDRALGPFQFLPATWVAVGVDANRDGVASPDNIVDAAHAAARYLCEADRFAGNPRRALFRYNRSIQYGDEVLERALAYAEDETALRLWFEVLARRAATSHRGPDPVGQWALPVTEVSREAMLRPHHTYPAWDLGLPVGTALFAMSDGAVTHASTNEQIAADATGMDLGRCGGQVSVTTEEGAVITYCHLQAVAVRTGERVVAGDYVGESGGQPGRPGAGNTTGPHLHLQISFGGMRCPQTQLLAIVEGQPLSVSELPTSGCVS